MHPYGGGGGGGGGGGRLARVNQRPLLPVNCINPTALTGAGLAVAVMQLIYGRIYANEAGCSGALQRAIYQMYILCVCVCVSWMMASAD